MEITGSNASNVSAMATLWEQGHRQAPVSQDSTIKQEDSVRISSFPQSATLLSDDEVDTVLQDTMNSITSEPHEAMFVHSGLDASRVAALLA